MALSSPPLTPSILDASKAYLFLLSPKTNGSAREKIAGCLIAQRISTAMAVASSEESSLALLRAHSPEQPTSLMPVDLSAGLFCHPMPLPTPLGIPRIFVSSSHRRQGIASKLLSAAAETFIHGCPLDPGKGHVAFTQPTGAGSAIMQRWGKGGVRIYEERDNMIAGLLENVPIRKPDDGKGTTKKDHSTSQNKTQDHNEKKISSCSNFRRYV